MIPGDLLSAFPHRQFHTLPGLLDSWAALPNSYPNACMPMQGGNLYHFYDGLWYDPAERRTHDLPCERRTRYRLSQPDTVRWNIKPSFSSDTLHPINIQRVFEMFCLAYQMQGLHTCTCDRSFNYLKVLEIHLLFQDLEMLEKQYIFGYGA